MTLALVLLAALILAVPSRPSVERVLEPRPRNPSLKMGERPALVEDRRRRFLVCVAAGGVMGWAVAGWAGVLGGGLAGGVAAELLGRVDPPSLVRRREQVRRDLPLVADLLAACAEAGLPPERSLHVVARAVGGPLGDLLAAVAARLELGIDPVMEWSAVARDPQLAPLARAVLRSIESGAPLAAGLARLAMDRRRDLRTLGQLRARRVGVQAAAPLGLCFLPAFMLIGVVPTVVDTFSSVVLR
jgi:Flp pilus assembly protein TadB